MKEISEFIRYVHRINFEDGDSGDNETRYLRVRDRLVLINDKFDDFFKDYLFHKVPAPPIIDDLVFCIDFFADMYYFYTDAALTNWCQMVYQHRNDNNGYAKIYKILNQHHNFYTSIPDKEFHETFDPLIKHFYTAPHLKRFVRRFELEIKEDYSISMDRLESKDYKVKFANEKDAMGYIVDFFWYAAVLEHEADRIKQSISYYFPKYKFKNDDDYEYVQLKRLSKTKISDMKGFYNYLEEHGYIEKGTDFNNFSFIFGKGKDSKGTRITWLQSQRLLYSLLEIVGGKMDEIVEVLSSDFLCKKSDDEYVLIDKVKARATQGSSNTKELAWVKDYCK